MKKFIAIVVGILLSVIAQTTFAETTLSDIQDHDYSKAIHFLLSKEWVSGYPDGTFKPDNKINRAEFLKIAMNAAHKESEGGNCFPDVTNQWFAPYVCSAFKLGFIKGYEDGYFRPEKNITFAEASKVVTNVFGKEIEDFYTESWFHPYIKVLETNSAIPLSVTAFGQEITRGEMAYIVSGMAGVDQENGYTYDYLKTSSEASDKNGDTLEYIVSSGSNVARYGKDRNHVYRLPNLEIIEWADPENFSVSETTYGDSLDGYFTYGFSGNDFWYYNAKLKKEKIVEGIDKNSFGILVKNLRIKVPHTDQTEAPVLIFSDKAFCKFFDESLDKGKNMDKDLLVIAAQMAGLNQELKVYEDGTCAIVFKDTPDREFDYYSAIIARDKDQLFRFDDFSYEFKEFAKIDNATFKQISNLPFFKDKKGVHYFGDSYQLVPVENESVKILAFDITNKLYLRDEKSLWGYSDETDKFTKINSSLKPLDNSLIQFKKRNIDEAWKESDFDVRQIDYIGIARQSDKSVLYMGFTKENLQTFVNFLIHSYLKEVGVFIGNKPLFMDTVDEIYALSDFEDALNSGPLDFEGDLPEADLKDLAKRLIE